MADRIQAFAITVARGTTQAAPSTTAMTFPDGIVTDIEIVFPGGCSGLVGLQLLVSGTQLIPFNASAFLIADNESLKWPLSGFPLVGKWSARAYNTDKFAHTLQIRMLINEIVPTVGRVSLAPIPIG